MKLASYFLFFFGVLISLPSYSKMKSHDHTYRRMVFFGDSLTDTGNFPEPANVNAPDINNLNLYVPITNPVPLSSYGKAEHLFSFHEKKTNIPSLDFLKKSIPTQGLINGKNKTLYSINWPLYLSYNYAAKQPLITWYHHYINHSLPATNINYAWAGAITGKGDGEQCFYKSGETYPGLCSAQTIAKQRLSYLNYTNNNPSYDKNTHYALTDIQIPSLKKQVSLYLDDKTVSVKDNTSFFIYIGGNDIGDFLRNYHKDSSNPLMLMDSMIHLSVKKIAQNVLDAVNQIESAYKKTKYKNYNFHILTLLNLANMHEAYHYEKTPVFGNILKIVINYIVDRYNHSLREAFKNRAHVTVLEAGSFVNNAASESRYASSIKNGTTCIASSSEYIDPVQSSNNNCNYFSGYMPKTFFNWNNNHFTSKIHQLMADFILQYIP